MTATPSDFDASSGDAGDELDLTPRTTGPEPSAGRKWFPRIVLAGIAVALVAVLLQTLGDASLFFYNVDEAVERRTELGDDRFTLQGTPVNSATTFNDSGQEAVAFTVTFEGVDADVVHIGSPAELFQPSVPVVLEGRWIEGVPAGADFADGANAGYHFESTRMLVKHDNDYRVDNQDRLDDAERGGMVEGT